jgi:hypothetical protein
MLDGRIPSPPVDQGVSISAQASNNHPFPSVKNEPADPVMSGGTPPNMGEANIAPNAPNEEIPHPYADLRGGTVPRNAVPGPSIGADPPDDITVPIRGLTDGGAALPTVNLRAPPTSPPRCVRYRGIFIIGNSAPVKIDEGIEVHLRDGVNGQVDFII